MMKKKLLIIVGAGASIDFGLPSLSAVDKLLDECAQTYCPLADHPDSNLYRHCRDLIEAYYAESPTEYLRKWPNFEEVLYQLNLLGQYLSDDYRTHGGNALLKANALPDVQEFGRTRKKVDGNVLRNLSTALMDRLVEHFIDKCDELPTTKGSEISRLGGFLQALRAVFDIGIITLNYDNVFTKACDDLFTGFDADTHQFAPLQVLRRDDWHFIYHLHGSVHFAMTEPGHGITWATAPQKGHAVQASGRNNQGSMEGTGYPMSNIVAGYGKTQQILRQPFNTYFAAINRVVQEADSLLFLGYGFSDQHLNALIAQAPRRPTVVIDFASEDQDSLPLRMDEWSYRLFQTIRGCQHRMSRPGSSSVCLVSELKAEHELEVSVDPEYPLAVWYNGLLAACEHPDKILTHLC
ncbi:hypothetical protein J2T41_004496 [Pseudomonas citronellolis]|uniref:SIR2 family protein n=1 Tax=Pseudomonas citronellolis TaxID=53408 RepID=UPI00209F35C4|nr:SIR2 family protein [Pseudomonas citronellolis]MCP1644857.1 hypothetical protein [Pseudomonas citronellolis]MCP1667802.1 hypothetical protein [Pseudomonas citronellolis]MCP1699102.1 hypothetical protein [Pseudomonas citronellolis]MCP1704909.1 hypothetical protein [Pseudomonas citronellolis]MCP1799665.1 hypothetical protein [Pseudomonas citronellolis]